jgi:hypothetical protein
VGGRGVNILQPLLLGWVSLVQRHLLPGGAVRARRELRTLVASYDASHLGVTALERLAAAGFADVAAAVAARWAGPRWLIVVCLFEAEWDGAWGVPRRSGRKEESLSGWGMDAHALRPHAS